MGSYHPLVVCTISRGNSKITATNDGQTSPRFRVRHADGNVSYSGHAECRALVGWRHYDHPERLKVVVSRYKKDGTVAMAKPCINCQAALWRAGILARHVWYTNEEGKLQRMTDNKERACR
jgi:hypothetical protein